MSNVVYLTNPDDRTLNDYQLTLTNEGALYPAFCAYARRNATLNEWQVLFVSQCVTLLRRAGCELRPTLYRNAANSLRLYYEEHVNEG